MFERSFRWLNIHEKEVGLFLWSLTLLFLVRSCGIILNNYAETAFLKRYGVEFLPIVNMLNAVATVVIMGFYLGLVRRFRGPRLLAGQFLFSGVSIVFIRLLIPLGLDMIYPLLFMLKAQYEALLAMLFWNLANDLFNTRQSKRIFPLITAGGVVGQILASFATPLIASTFHFDNMLVVYLLITIAGAGVVRAMEKQFPSLLIGDEQKGSPKSRSSMVQEIKAVLPMLKSSMLLRLMIVLTFMPNVVIPIMNYQFNYAVDTYFASETSLITFFGYFRGILNIISLVILLFVGKIYGRWGLPVALMFHPFNYVIAFLAFLLRFDVVAAMYARMSTNILRTTINVPANATIMGLFPESYRSLVRPFLRGTVVRIALFAGSGLILISDPLFHPRYLSLVALPFVLGWLSAPFILKQKYATILIDLIKQNQLDLSTLKPSEVEQLFRGQKIQAQLKDAFMSSPPASALWHAALLKQLDYPNLDVFLMQKIEELDSENQVHLLHLLSNDLPDAVVPRLKRLTADGDITVAEAVLQVVNRLSPRQKNLFALRPFLDHSAPEIRAQAAAGLFSSAPDECRQLITQWMTSRNRRHQKAGIIAAGASRHSEFEQLLRDTIKTAPPPENLAAALDSLHGLDLHDLNDVVTPFLEHPDKGVRLAAISAYHVNDKAGLDTAIMQLADEDPQIREMAENRIFRAGYVDGKALIKAMDHPNRHLRESIIQLLDKLQIKDLDLYRFASDQLEGAYKYLNESSGIALLPENAARNLLLAHLQEQCDAIVQRVLRVLAIQDQSGRLQVIRRGLVSRDHRQNANSQEALDDLLDPKLSRILIPLLEEDAKARALESGRRHYGLADYRDNATALMNHLLARYDDWISVLMALFLLQKAPQLEAAEHIVADLRYHGNPHIRTMAQRVAVIRSGIHPKEDHQMDVKLALPDIVLSLKPIEIFEDLSVNELAAVASAIEEIAFDADETVIREGDPGDTLYLMVEGEVAVIKTEADGTELILDHIAEGDHFGEMALFEDIPRSASIRTLKASRMLMLHKQEFNEMVREYPRIALNICRVFSGRIRKLHHKISTIEKSIPGRKDA